MWALLIVTLPTRPNAVRLRIWRSIKALGCAALRDGAYLLPADQAAALDGLAAEVRALGGTASVLALAPRDEAQHTQVLALFDRAEAYGAWRAGATALHEELAGLGEAEARRRLRSVADALQAVRHTDHYPGAAARQAQSEFDALRAALDARFCAGEPRAAAAHGLPRLEVARFQGKRWATRARPWVDRLACAWLIRRYIDPQARFVWLADPARAPRGAIGFDHDGARFSHVGERVSFEVMVASFGLDADPGLRRVAAVVHCLDVGGMPVAEAAGFEAVLSGLRELHADDDALAAAAAHVFDAFHANPGIPA